VDSKTYEIMFAHFGRSHTIEHEFHEAGNARYRTENIIGK